MIACDGYVRTSVGGVVVGEMMQLVAWCVHGYFGCYRAVARTHAGGAFASTCRTRLGASIGEGGDPFVRAIEQNGDNQDTLHVDLSLYADAVFVKQWI